jgi:hypothetical protein
VSYQVFWHRQAESERQQDFKLKPRTSASPLPLKRRGVLRTPSVKARLAEYLISNPGFTTFVLENNWGSSQLLDAYINGGAGDFTAIMAKSLFSSWQTHE